MESQLAYDGVDVAIVMESTYPYLKGGVSAVVHDIVVENPDLTFGIIHITWDSTSPTEDLYGVPSNVRWVHPLYLSMQEHQIDFRDLTPGDLGMRGRARTALAHRVFDALESVVAGDPEPVWSLYDEGMNPRTRRYPLWALLGTQEFMQVLQKRCAASGSPWSTPSGSCASSSPSPAPSSATTCPRPASTTPTPPATPR